MLLLVSFFFSSRRRHSRFGLGTGGQTWAFSISFAPARRGSADVSDFQSTAGTGLVPQRNRRQLSGAEPARKQWLQGLARRNRSRPGINGKPGALDGTRVG